MRIDKYLKVARIIKRRTVAQEACEKGRILVNGKLAKPAKNIEANDIIEIKYMDNTLKIKVTATKEAVKKEEATKLYEIVEEKNE